MDNRDEKGRFTEGHPGGPGKPKGSISLVAILKRQLEKIDPLYDKSTAEALIEQYLQKAMEEGDGQAIRDMMDRTDGKPKQEHAIEGHVEIHFDSEDEEL